LEQLNNSKRNQRKRDGKKQSGLRPSPASFYNIHGWHPSDKCTAFTWGVIKAKRRAAVAAAGVVRIQQTYSQSRKAFSAFLCMYERETFGYDMKILFARRVACFVCVGGAKREGAIRV
jgi:hypothetical protein